MKLTFRFAEERDERRLLEWANDEFTRANSFNVNVIEKEDHHRWFSHRLNDASKRRIYIAENFENAVGQVRFELSSHNIWELDYSIDARYRGKGLGRKVLEGAISDFRVAHRDAVLIGKVKELNSASRRIFESLGFELIANGESETKIYRDLGQGISLPTLVLASPNRRNLQVMNELIGDLPDYNIVKMSEQDSLSVANLTEIQPAFVFFLHWSWLVPEEIYSKFNCIIFHMTDLPFGRGGSPLQNLIVRGHKETALSAIQCVAEIDAGPVYSKQPLSLAGTAEDILQRASWLMKEMILDIIRSPRLPVAQKGKVVRFTRRKPEEGDISSLESLEQVYDYVRMLDAEDYPPAFFRKGKFKFNFTNAQLGEKYLEAKVRIEKSDDE